MDVMTAHRLALPIDFPFEDVPFGFFGDGLGESQLP
jgi:hypothetical protein